jgi:hypothetical protein
LNETEPGQNSNPLQSFGLDVKKMRLGRKLTQKQLGGAAGYSEGYVSKVEAGKLLPRPSMTFARGCDLAFGTNGFFAGMLRRIDEGDHPSWFVPYLNLEQKASRIQDYSAGLVMGLLQTEEYAWEVFRASHPRSPAEDIDGKASARVRRRRLFDREPPPSLWVILHEASLRTLVGNTAVMAGQLEYLLESAKSPGIDVQVMPFSAGAPARNAMMPYTLLGFEDGSPTVLYSDGPQGGKLYDSAKTVGLYGDIYARLRAHALPPGESRAVLTSALKEYRR